MRAGCGRSSQIMCIGPVDTNDPKPSAYTLERVTSIAGRAPTPVVGPEPVIGVEPKCKTQGAEPKGKTQDPSVSTQSNASVSYTATVTVKTKADAVRAANTFAAMAATANSAPQQRNAQASMTDNPIMDAINGSNKSGNASGVSQSDLAFLKHHVASYSDTITASGAVVDGTSFAQNNLGNLGVSLQNANKASVTRTVTMANGNQSATLAYTVSDQSTSGATRQPA